MLQEEITQKTVMMSVRFYRKTDTGIHAEPL